MSKKLEDIRIHLDQLVLEATSQENELLESIRLSERILNDATSKMNTAYAEANVSEYHTAQDERRQASDAIEMYKAKLDSLKSNPLITREEYSSLSQDITDEQEKAEKKAFRRITKLIEEAIDINAHLLKEIQAGDECLSRLQIECFKDPEYLNAPDGAKRYRVKKWNDYKVPYFVDYLKNSDFYKASH